MERRKFLERASVIAAGSLLAGAKPLTGAPGRPNNTDSLLNKKVLYVWGGWEGHEPEQCRDIFAPWLRQSGAQLTVSDSLDAYLDEDMMSSVDLIIQAWTMGTISPEQSGALLKAVKNGAGLAGWHGGLGDSFRDNTEYQFMVGGQWVAHPGGVIPYRVSITGNDDPVTRGLEDFDMNSEQYYMHVDPNVKVLATTAFYGRHAEWIDGCVVPVVWKKYYGRGRVFYSSLGHVADDFRVPEALTIMKRGISWASQSKYEPKEVWISPAY